LAEQLDVQGTPTLIVNGWKLGRPPSEEELDRMVKAILAGKSPVSEV
jgi:protein-disulfide isomerase